MTRRRFDFAQRDKLNMDFRYSLAGLIVGMTFERDTLESRSVQNRVIGIGAVVGVLLTLTSIGSGSVTLPLLLVLLPSLGARVLVGSDVAFAAVLIPVAAIGHWSMNDVNP